MAEYNIPQKITVLGENWELVKNATDPSVSFPFNSVSTIDYDCSQLRDGLYRILITGYLPAAQGSLEQPKRLVFIGFNNIPIMQKFLTREDLKKCSIYKADIKEFANEFTSSFLGEVPGKKEQYDIKPYPDMTGGKDGREEQNDDA